MTLAVCFCINSSYKNDRRNFKKRLNFEMESALMSCVFFLQKTGVYTLYF